MKPVHLTAEQIDFYHAEGYLTLPRITTLVDLASIREIYDRLFAEQTGRDDGNQFDLAGADEDGAVARLPQILDPARYAPELNDLVFKRSAKELATQLLGGECSGEDHLILKPAGYGAPTPWHQDEAYWSSELVYDSLSIWMPLQDVTVESGCMQFVPRSHRRGIVAHRPIGGDPRVHGLEVEEFDETNVVACPVPAGGVTIHHCRTLHYAAPNTTPEPRRAYIQKFGRPTSPHEQPLDFHWKRTQQTARAKRAQQSEQAYEASEQVTVVVRNSRAEVARAVADVVERCLSTVERPVLGLATGATVEDVYTELVRRHRDGLSFANSTAFLLDEYIGLGSASKQAYRQFISERLSDQVDFGPKAIHGPNGETANPEAEARRYEAAVIDAGVDVQLLGIGRNGHIGFNEPGSSLEGGTHVVRLAATTRADNARFFPDGEATPESAITQGIATIMAARRIVLVAVGESKADAVAKALEGPITCRVPASVLQLHTDATFVLDTAAASLLVGWSA